MEIAKTSAFICLSVAIIIVGDVAFMLVPAVTRIGRYYRMTIPREVRKPLGLSENDEVKRVFEDGKIILRRRVRNIVKCPFCGHESSEEGFKLLREPWKLWCSRFYTVKMMECPRCHGVFNYYHGVGPRSDKVSEFVIRMKPGERLWCLSREAEFTAQFWRMLEQHLGKYTINGHKLIAKKSNSAVLRGKVPDIVITDDKGIPRLIIETKRKMYFISGRDGNPYITLWTQPEVRA